MAHRSGGRLLSSVAALWKRRQQSLGAVTLQTRARREENDDSAAEDVTDVYMGDGAERKGQEQTYTDGPHFSYFDEVEHWKAPRTAPSS